MADPEPSEADASAVVAVWFDLHAARIASYVGRRVGPSVALDVVADTFRVALERFDRFDPDRGSEQAWLIGIATNLLRRHWRTEERRLRAHVLAAGRDLGSIDPLVAVDESLDSRRAYARLADAIAALEPDDRDLLLLGALEHLSSSDVAVALGVPAATARTRLRRIRRRLAAAVEEEVTDE